MSATFAPDRPDPRVRCHRCGRMGRARVLFTQPPGWKRIGDSLGRAVYLCWRCR